MPFPDGSLPPLGPPILTVIMRWPDRASSPHSSPEGERPAIRNWLRLPGGYDRSWLAAKVATSTTDVRVFEGLGRSFGSAWRVRDHRNSDETDAGAGELESIRREPIDESVPSQRAVDCLAWRKAQPAPTTLQRRYATSDQPVIIELLLRCVRREGSNRRPPGSSRRPRESVRPSCSPGARSGRACAWPEFTASRPRCVATRHSFCDEHLAKVMKKVSVVRGR